MDNADLYRLGSLYLLSFIVGIVARRLEETAASKLLLVALLLLWAFSSGYFKGLYDYGLLVHTLNLISILSGYYLWKKRHFFYKRTEAKD